MKNLELCYPLQNILVTQSFGEVENLEYYKKHGVNFVGHNGIDFASNDGTPVYATHDGTVTYAGEDGASGLLVVIRTNEPFNYNGQPTYFKTLYAHLKKDSFLVHASQEVKAGQQIACADNTGLSTGSHLHFGLKPVHQGESDWTWFNLEQDNGYNGAIDPRPYLNGKPPFIVKGRPFNKDLYLGMRNDEDVKELQRRLGVTPIWGNFGPVTLLAVIKYQRENGIKPALGYVGKLTRASLNT